MTLKIIFGKPLEKKSPGKKLKLLGCVYYLYEEADKLGLDKTSKALQRAVQTLKDEIDFANNH